MKQDQNGFSVIEVVIVLVVLVAIGAVGYKIFGTKNVKRQDSKSGTGNSSSKQGAQSDSDVQWMQTADGYQPNGKAPACPDKIVSQFPADISKATSVLYPGQTRGGNYKPHGGLRFDHSKNNEITVKAPFDGTIIDGATYYADGVDDVQYTFDVMNSCGMMFRLGHLLTLSPEMAKIAEKFPAPVKGDSRTTNVNPEVSIKAGTVMATAVGTSSDNNTFFDWGIYDWNTPNKISSDPTWLQDQRHSNALAKHAVCWFDELSSKDEATIKALPAGDPTSGKNSDYCN